MEKKESKEMLDLLNKSISSGKADNLEEIKKRLGIEKKTVRQTLPLKKWIPSFASGLVAAISFTVMLLSLADYRNIFGKGSYLASMAMMATMDRMETSLYLLFISGFLFITFCVITAVLLKRAKRK